MLEGRHSISGEGWLPQRASHWDLGGKLKEATTIYDPTGIGVKLLQCWGFVSRNMFCVAVQNSHFLLMAKPAACRR